MSRSPITHGWRYYGCARWGCDAVNPDYQSYGAAGRSWCLHHRPGPIRRFLMRWTVFPAPPTRNAATLDGMLPISVVHRHYELRSNAAPSLGALAASERTCKQGDDTRKEPHDR